MFLSSVNCSSKLIKPKDGVWEPLIYSQSVRSTGNNLDLELALVLSWRGSLEPLVCSWSVRSIGNNLGFPLVPEAGERGL